MASTSNARSVVPQDAANKAPTSNDPRLLWNPENVKDVAESVGIGNLGDEALRTLSQDVEYRIGQVIVEALRFMRAAKRTTMTVQDILLALKVLDVEPLYGYDSTRPLRYGEASLGPGQPLFYIEDEEVDFEKLINAPLPKVPRDMSFTGHWLAIEGVQPTIPQNPSTGEARNQELLPKGPGAHPALPALAGNQAANFRPAVKHIISTELTLYFEKVQSALLDDNPDPEVDRLRDAALESISSDPGIHQLIPYFVNFISNEVTHHLDDLFVLRHMMSLTNALIQNPEMFLDPYATPLSAPVLTCLMGRKLGTESGTDELKQQYQLRELAASLIGKIAKKYSRTNKMLRPKLTRSCLKHFLDANMTPAVWYGAILGLSATGGPEAVKVLVLPNLKGFEQLILQKVKNDTESSRIEYEALVGAIVKVIREVAPSQDMSMTNGVNGVNEHESTQLKEFLGEIIGERILRLGDHRLIEVVLQARAFM
ncbi:TATA box binding protein associated factor [Pseudomassariella vexata]|uniref:TBP-associated factor 6 n=1 Tax=Pseudomassariella vexata TaxID=1141098 RepID=A0A1Y2ELA5_9PEZI|nr:TATA box binding protein associated factor [Pseudomassariella vexata]ORY71645.1 TATA box binding protein associated factor [Pseudomassariella vexata]